MAPEDLELIDRLAGQRNMDRTEYMTLAALGRLDDAGEDYSERDWKERVEDRLGRLEDLAFGQ